MEEVQVVPPTQTKAPSEPPQDWLSELARRSKERQSSSAVTEEERQERFSLSEGSVIITYPRKLSSESVEDLEAYLQIFLKKAKREASS